MNSAAVKINANATSDTNDYANGSNLIQPKVARVSTMNSNAGRRWWSSLLLFGIVFSFGLCLLNPNNAFATTARNGEYSTSVRYGPCYDEEGELTDVQSRTETWRDKHGNIVYEENVNCFGDISTTGKRPTVVVGDIDNLELADLGGGQLYCNTNPADNAIDGIIPVTVQLIDPTGQTIQSLVVTEDAIIDASSILDGLPYAVVSTTTGNGTIDVKTIMKYGGNIFISPTENK